MQDFEEQLEVLRQHILDSGRQNWLFGAGVSFDANIPLMVPLTTRVKDIIQENGSQVDKDILEGLEKEINENSHIEHYLSHIGDLIAIADRSRRKQATLDNKTFSLEGLNKTYLSIIKAIGETVRYGYKGNDDIGTAITYQLRILHGIFPNNFLKI